MYFIWWYEKKVLLLQSKMNYLFAKVVKKMQSNKFLNNKMTKFQQFYKNVRVGDASSIRKEIEKHVSKPTFLNWVRGTFEPDSRWWSILNSISEKFGYGKIYCV